MLPSPEPGRWVRNGLVAVSHKIVGRNCLAAPPVLISPCSRRNHRAFCQVRVRLLTGLAYVGLYGDVQGHQHVLIAPVLYTLSHKAFFSLVFWDSKTGAFLALYSPISYLFSFLPLKPPILA